MTREEIKKQWELEFGAKYEDYQRANVYTAVDILDFAESIVNKLLISSVVSSKRDETLELLEEIMIKVKDADSEVENGIYDPMLECAKHILNNYKIERR